MQRSYNGRRILYADHGGDLERLEQGEIDHAGLGGTFGGEMGGEFSFVPADRTHDVSVVAHLDNAGVAEGVSARKDSAIL